MRPTVVQLQALIEHLGGVYVDHMLDITIKEAPGLKGMIEVRMLDHWGREVLILDRKGELYKPVPEGSVAL